jgi:hypothetical protein
LGRSQRVLQNETIKKLPVERIVVEIDDDYDKENAIIEIVSPPRASIDKHTDEVEVGYPLTPREDNGSGTIEWQEVVEVVDSPTPSEGIQSEAIEWQQDEDPPTPSEDIQSKAVEWQQDVDPPTPCKDIQSEAIKWQQDADPSTAHEDMKSEDIEWQQDVEPPTPREDIDSEAAIEWKQDVNPPTPCEAIESVSIDADEPEESVATMFQRVELLASSGYPKSAFKLLLDMLEHRYGDLDKEEKIEVHTQIGLAANALGLLD